MKFFYSFRLAISRVLYGLVGNDYCQKLKSIGFLSRDCRCKERKSKVLTVAKFIVFFITFKSLMNLYWLF